MRVSPPLKPAFAHFDFAGEEPHRNGWRLNLYDRAVFVLARYVNGIADLQFIYSMRHFRHRHFCDVAVLEAEPPLDFAIGALPTRSHRRTARP